MLDIPYIKSQPNGCALADYTMVAKYYFPETTEEEIKKITNAESGYVVWAFPFWLWIMDKGITIEEYDTCNYIEWAEKGIAGLKESVSKKEFDYYKSNTKNLETLTDDVKLVIRHPNFTYHNIRPDYEKLKTEVNNGSVCSVIINSKKLNNKQGFTLHALVVLEVTDEHIIFHDPQENPDPDKHIKRKEAKNHFIDSWLRSDGGYELCIYRQKMSNYKVNSGT